ncbi:hypothetical protein MSG28_003039 [Choristoneura fumiferana]|uniref:Uncharacterized protein n=1 Tax=Choristoneura fumiferana TaxID=7141 RepID=A0ACC0JKE4_CHOFU|nr:hypothetical protein MSG28_003039 [Choristoneura fumiferana]
MIMINMEIVNDPSSSRSGAVAVGMGSTMIVVLLALVGFISAQQNPSNEFRSNLEILDTYSTNLDEPAYRLRDNIQPSWVYVDLDVFLSESRFNGVVRHQVTITGEPLSQIVLHQNVVAITGVNIVDANDNPIALSLESPYETDSYFEILTINVASPISAGEYTISVSFRGQIHENQFDRGFYKGYYFYNNQKIEYATTQFQPYHARKAFPCFDEPQFKSRFVISITRDESLRPSYSNMAIAQNETVAPGRIRETFLPTPTISVYLIAFHVSDFVETNTSGTAARPFGIVSRPGVEDHHEYAHDIGLKITNEMSEYFAYDYYTMGQGQPMKNDHIAVPDFPAGAMENWGMVNYREAYLLYDEDNTNLNNKIFIATIMAHELAHKWFGNLVTCFWWSNLWLNESFASFFEYFSAHRADTDLELADQFVVDYVHSALNWDSSAGATPMNLSTVADNLSITGHFSTTSYAKGASVLRMMEHFVGPDTFKLALQTYLKDNEFGLGTPEDMYNAFRTATAADPTFAQLYNNIDIGTVLDSWIQTPGSPVLNVEVNTDTGVISFTQRRFQLSGTPHTQLWHLPYTWTHGGNPVFTSTKPVGVLSIASDTVQMPAGHNWVLFNIQQSGLYRVNYDDHNWEMLAAALREEKDVFPKLNRAQAYLLELMEHAVETVGYNEGPNDSTSVILNRMQILNYACNLGHEGCVEDSLAKWNAFRANPQTLVPKNARRYVYCSGIRHGDATDYNFLFNLYQTSENAADMVVILRTLGCTKDQTLLASYLQQTLTNDRIRYHDRTNAFQYALQGNQENLETVLTFVKNNVATIRTAYGGEAQMSQVFAALVLALLALAKADNPISLQRELDPLTPSSDVIANAETVYRLPHTVEPLEYDIYIDLYFAERIDRPFSYDGREYIVVQVVEENVTQIVLHANVDRIIAVSVLTESGSPVAVNVNEPFTLQPQYHFLIINLANSLTNGEKYVLYIEYSSTMNVGPMKRGIWRGAYTDANNVERVYATTHFQPYNARQAFPCWDEPLYKSTFKVHLSRPGSYNGVYSNTRIGSTDVLADGRRRDNFMVTPKMSSYLVTFLVSESFTVIAQDTSFSPPIRIIGRSNTVGLGDHALDLAVKMTTFFDEYFEIPYETLHPNLLNDHISSPDWASAGTENWGMVSYRELYLTLDARESIMSNEHYAATLMFSKYEFDDHFNSRYLQSSLSFDSGTGTVPLNHDVNTPAQVTGHFGTISYSKGAAFLRMIADMITPATFRRACTIFLRNNAFEPTDQYDLYNAFADAISLDNTLSEYQGFDFAEYYRIWVNEPGYPILQVDINHSTGLISLKQERFFLSASATPTGQIYPIPITYTTKSSPTFTSHYRVIYDDRTWALIAEALLNEPDTIHYANRAQVVDDVFALMRSERMSYSFGFNILRFLRNENNMHVWDSAITGFTWLRNRLRHMPEKQAEFDAFVLDNMQHLINTVGFNVLSTETPTDTMNRQAALHFACLLGHERCVAESRDRFVAYLELTLTDEVRSHDKANSFNYALLGNKENAYTVLQFVKNNIDEMRVAYVEDAPPTPVHTCLSNLAAYLEEPELVEYEEWLRSTQTGTLQFNSAISAITSARNNMAWGTANADVILGATRDDATRVVTSFATTMSLLKLLVLPALLTVAIAELPVDVEEIQELVYRNEVDRTIYRIPDEFDPIHHEVEIIPYFEDEGDKPAWSFDGEMTFELKPKYDNLTSITLQENVRSITSVTLTDSAGRPVALNETLPFERIRQYHFLRINLKEGFTLVNGESYFIHIVYVGNINETPFWYAATHLQPVNSRQVFPCFDEPGFKSTFTMIITRPLNFTETYSNSRKRVQHNINLGNRIREVFHTTPRMPAYLISFHVSEEFAVLADNHDRERPYRILGRPNAAGQGEYALEVGPPVTKWLEDYLDIGYYTMGEDMKNDQIAVPDWASGATENWGFVSYREVRLLYEEGETNALDKMYIGTITAHELAHKWFGNLVDEKMELADQFQIMYVQSALSADSSAATRALQHTVNSPAEVTGHFTGISYSKGATFLMMLKYLFTEATFKKALNLFLMDKSYEHAFPSDLYDAFARAVREDGTTVSNVNVEDFMQYWVDEPGYPVLNVDVNMDSGVITLSQERFFISATATPTSQVWPLPLTWTTETTADFDNLRPSRIMSGSTETIQKTAGTHEWVIFNLQQRAGLYRVNYNTYNWELLAAALKSDRHSIHYLNRAQDEDSYYVWYPAITGFNWLRNRFLHLPNMLQQYDNLVYTFLDTVIADLGYNVIPSESLTRTLNRFFVLSFACSIGHEGCVNDARARWTALRTNGVSVNPNLRRHVFCEGLKAGDYQDWNFLYQRRLNSNNMGDSVAMLRALGCTSNVQAVNE